MEKLTLERLLKLEFGKGKVKVVKGNGTKEHLKELEKEKKNKEA